MYKIILILALGMAVIACKNDSNSETNVAVVGEHDHRDHASHNHDDQSVPSVNSKIEEAARAEYKVLVDRRLDEMVKSGMKNTVSSAGIADPCILISEDWIRSNTKYDPFNLRIKSGGGDDKSKNKSCFYQWSVDGDPNAGFLISVTTNPLPEEITDYAAVYMEAKVRDGESKLGEEQTYPFKRIDAAGSEAILNYELQKAYFRLDTEYLFMLAFNMDLSREEMADLTRKIANEALVNYFAAMKL